MNYRGSYRKLLGNAKAAMMAAIEIYNKPKIDYRDECFVILLLNAWELVLKAVVAKQKLSIYYPKRRRQLYRTLSLTDAFHKAETFFPTSLAALPVRRNLELLTTYRDNAVHFYNAAGFGCLIHALAQTSMVNFKDLVHGVFGLQLGDALTWHLLPLGLSPPLDPIAYIAGKAAHTQRKGTATQQFLTDLSAAVSEVEKAHADTGRLLTIFSVSLQSTKKIQKADVIVGVTGASPDEGPLIIHRIMDPNSTHPLRQKEVLAKVPRVGGRDLTTHVFQAVAWKHDLKSNDRLCWRATEGVLTRYANDIVPWLKRLSEDEVQTAVRDYRAYLRARKHTGKVGGYS